MIGLNWEKIKSLLFTQSDSTLQGKQEGTMAKSE
jgi:hypothetical protein